MLMISAAGFAGQAAQSRTLRLQPIPENAKDRIFVLAKIWRSERNFWIAAICFMTWWLLYSYQHVLVKWIQLRDENQILKEQLKPAESSTGERGDKKND